MCNDKNRPFWRRHMATVPKGFLRYYVLKLLSEKQLAGSEIMEQIKEETDGRWKPSPGSIYPLLSLLQDHGYIKEIPVDESGKKRYQLTEAGEKFFQEQEKLREQDIRKTPLFFSPFWFNHFKSEVDREKTRQIRKSVRDLFKAMTELRSSLHTKLSDETLEEVNNIIINTTEKIKEIAKKIRE